MGQPGAQAQPVGACETEQYIARFASRIGSLSDDPRVQTALYSDYHKNDKPMGAINSGY
jgi:hypothetical protein